MASPIAHSFAGFWTLACQRGHFKTQLTAHWRQCLLPLGVLILLANAPDLDLLLGNAVHRGFTHSLMAATSVSLALSCVWRIAPGFWRSAIVYFIAYSSHLLIDFFTGTKIGWTNSGFGMPLFWPWPKTFSSPLILIFGAITVVASVLWKRKLKSRILRKAKLKSGTNRPTPERPTHLLFNLQHQKREASPHLPTLQDQK